MVQHFEEEVKRKIVALHVEGRTIKSLVDEYKVSKALTYGQSLSILLNKLHNNFNFQLLCN